MWYNCKCKRKINSNLKVWYIMKNTIIKSILAVILGLVIGIFSKWGDVMPGDNVIIYFGLISTGLVIWLAIGTLLILKSKNRKEFSIIYSLFMISMLISYYLFSATVVKYLYNRIIIFWIVIFIVALILGNIIFSKRHTRLFRLLFVLASIIFLIYDAIEINGIQLQVVIPELLLSILVLITINKSIKNNNKSE